MSCHQCAKKLPFTAQKIACPVCKFIMCNKCLSYNLPNHTTGSSQQKSTKVCLQCYERAINKVPDVDPRASDPPINFLRRLEELQKKKLARPTPPTSRPALTTVDSDTDKLAERLDSLTAEEVGVKISILAVQFMYCGPYYTSIFFTKRAKLPTEDQLRARLDALSDFITARGVRPKSETQSDTEEDQVKRVLDQAIDEARIVKRYGLSDAKDAKAPKDARTYCSLCDNVAVVICPACMDEEFCNHCFRRTHKHKHMRHHEFIPIEKTDTS